jgi:hypothetical protein
MAYITSRCGPEPGTGACGSHLQAAAQTFVGGRASPPPPGLAQDLKHARCIRTHEVLKFRDPDGSGETCADNLEPNGVVFQNAGTVCHEKSGTLSGSQPEPPGRILARLTAVRGGGLRPVGAVPTGAVPPRNSRPGANG